jgi:hypothetical protein
VLVLRLHEGLGEEQTGELLGCPVTQVRAELDEARAALRRGLDAARAEDPDVVPTLGAPAGPTPTVLPGFPDRGPVPPVLPPGEVLER